MPPFPHVTMGGRARGFGRAADHPRVPGGFTLIELLVVLAIIAMLITLALPRYFHSVERSKEAVLRQDLAVMRSAIDKFVADQGRYPQTLDEMVDRRYISKVPQDPVTDSAETWVRDPHPDRTTTGIYDVHSGAPGSTLAGEPYSSL